SATAPKARWNAPNERARSAGTNPSTARPARSATPTAARASGRAGLGAIHGTPRETAHARPTAIVAAIASVFATRSRAAVAIARPVAAAAGNAHASTPAIGREPPAVSRTRLRSGTPYGPGRAPTGHPGLQRSPP